MDLITVIINVYNCEKFISKCIDSIVNQTYKNLDILIINDGSTDNTLSICKSYTDPRIRIINQDNMGLSLSRNVGLDNALGKYLYFIDADDYIELDTIEYLYNLCVKYDVGFATCKSIDIYNYDFTVTNIKEDIQVLPSSDLLKRVLLSIDRCGTTWNKLVRKDIYDDLRFEDRIINDMAVAYKLPLKIDKYVFSNQIKYYYFRNIYSITGNHKSNRAIDEYKVAFDRYNYLKNIYPNLYDNEIGLLHSIVMVYNHNSKEVDDFLNKECSKKKYNKLFSLNKVLKSDIAPKEKIKMILYRISPRLERYIQYKYIKRKKFYED